MDEFAIQGRNRLFVIGVLDGDDDVHLAGALVYHSYVDVGVGQRAADAGRRTLDAAHGRDRRRL